MKRFNGLSESEADLSFLFHAGIPELTVDKLMELSYNHRQINFACRSILGQKGNTNIAYHIQGSLRVFYPNAVKEIPYRGSDI